MTDVFKIQAKIYYGYNKAAVRLGKTFDIYRSATFFDPLNIANKIGSIHASFNVAWSYEKANSYGNAVWQTLVDGRVVFQYDYLVGVDGTWFINSEQTILPILSVECRKIVNIARPTQNTGPGYGGYAGYRPDTAIPLGTNVPVSILLTGGSRGNKVGLPTETAQPTWKILMPALDGTIFRNGDVFIDDANFRYAIIDAEKTNLGWRFIAVELGT